MKHLYFFFFSFFLFAACNTSEEKNHADTLQQVADKDVLPEKSNLNAIKQQKIFIDTAIAKGDYKPQILEKYNDHPQLKPFIMGSELSEAQLEKLTSTYNVFKDKSEAVVAIAEFPFLASGDGFIVKTHYFDKDGNTFAYERQTNFFNSVCADVAYETKTYFYDNNFAVIDSTYKLYDQDDKALNKNDCQMLYDEPVQVYPDLNTYSNRIGYQQ